MKVKFIPQNVEFEIKQGQSVMDLAHEKGLPIRSTCNGLPSCAECRVKVVDGEWNLNPPSRKELSLIGTGFYIDQRRLSCQMLCFGDVTIDLTEQVEKGAEGPVTKKFLTKVHKATAEESHSLGGVLIEQEGGLLNEVKEDVKAHPVREERSGGGDAMREPRENRDRDRGRNQGGGRDQGGGRPGGGHQQNAGGGGGGQPRGEGGHGGGGRRRRRGGRGRNRGGGHGGGGGGQRDHGGHGSGGGGQQGNRNRPQG